jgi:hypothetical protein
MSDRIRCFSIITINAGDVESRSGREITEEHRSGDTGRAGSDQNSDRAMQESEGCSERVSVENAESKRGKVMPKVGWIRPCIRADSELGMRRGP